MYRTLVIIRHTFLESVVQPIFLLLLALGGGVLVIFGGTYMEPAVTFNGLSAIVFATNPADTVVSPTVTIVNPVTVTEVNVVLPLHLQGSRRR